MKIHLFVTTYKSVIHKKILMALQLYIHFSPLIILSCKLSYPRRKLLSSFIFSIHFPTTNFSAFLFLLILLEFSILVVHIPLYGEMNWHFCDHFRNLSCILFSVAQCRFWLLMCLPHELSSLSHPSGLLPEFQVGDQLNSISRCLSDLRHFFDFSFKQRHMTDGACSADCFLLLVGISSIT